MLQELGSGLNKYTLELEICKIYNVFLYSVKKMKSIIII